MYKKRKIRAEKKSDDNQENSSKSQINWFPGHMAKTRRKIKEILPLIDAVAEVVDARVPKSSRNPELRDIIGDKPLIILLNKCDMADHAATAEWIAHYSAAGIPAIALDCKTGKGISAFKDTVKNTLKSKLKAYEEKGMAGKPLRVMVVGIPNVGKSSFINRIAGNNRAKAENRPGVTRGNQWFTVDKQLELLDTPGVLWPKFEDPQVGLNLAFCGSIKDEILDTASLALELIKVLQRDYPQLLRERYKLDELDEDALVNMEAIAAKRGFILSGKRVDYERCARTVLDEFRGGKIGNITLEKVQA